VTRTLHDVIVVGAGAAGLATAIFAARESPGASIAVLDGARTVGAKVLVSGGGRCNVTNRAVTERDFNGGPATLVRRVLRACPVEQTITFFREIGVPLHEEAHGKLFPETNRARTVLDALVGESRSRGVRLLASHRVTAIASRPGHFELESPAGPVAGRVVVLATGGRSLARTGSDGFGYELATAQGHTIVATTPALVPLVLDGDFHRPLAGVSADVDLALTTGTTIRRRVPGRLLYTHFGVSGPAVLDLSRHWLRLRLEGADPAVAVSHWPGATFDRADALLRDIAARRPRARVTTTLARAAGAAAPDDARPPAEARASEPRLPAALADALVARSGLAADLTWSHVTREARRRLAHTLTALPLAVVDSRGYDHAEVTAGGVDLREVDVATMESRRRARLFLVGEILDVDGRLGGFNFQWAWASARVAGRGIAAVLR
jgi:predicted Rossmann fold flavoprotein